MNEQIKCCHSLLNNVYDDCENFYNRMKQQYKNVKMNFYKGHYIKINNKYKYQKYYMPVISINTLLNAVFKHT